MIIIIFGVIVFLIISFIVGLIICRRKNRDEQANRPDLKHESAKQIKNIEIDSDLPRQA